MLGLLLAFPIAALMVTRDGELVTPRGAGTATLEAGTFEAFL